MCISLVLLSWRQTTRTQEDQWLRYCFEVNSLTLYLNNAILNWNAFLHIIIVILISWSVRVRELDTQNFGPIYIIFCLNLMFNECEGISYLDMGMPNNLTQNHFFSFWQGKNGELANSPRLNIRICYKFTIYVYISLFFHGGKHQEPKRTND